MQLPPTLLPFESLFYNIFFKSLIYVNNISVENVLPLSSHL